MSRLLISVSYYEYSIAFTRVPKVSSPCPISKEEVDNSTGESDTIILEIGKQAMKSCFKSLCVEFIFCHGHGSAHHIIQLCHCPFPKSVSTHGAMTGPLPSMVFLTFKGKLGMMVCPTYERLYIYIYILKCLCPEIIY